VRPQAEQKVIFEEIVAGWGELMGGKKVFNILKKCTPSKNRAYAYASS